MSYTISELKNIAEILSELNEEDFEYIMDGYERRNRRKNFMKNSIKKKPLVDKPHRFLSVSGKRLRGR